MIDDPRVKAASLTGSEPAGARVASQAGRRIKKTVLELGGSDPFVVMPSADLKRAAQVAVEARIINNGQSCIAAKRFIVHERVAAEFEQRFVDGMNALKVGDPLNESTQVGPMATPSIREDLDRQVQQSIQMGARLLGGGSKLRGPGNFYQPTVLADAPADSPAYREEMFGPVAVLFRAKGLDQALQIANDTEFGLGASAWTNEPEEQQRCIRRTRGRHGVHQWHGGVRLPASHRRLQKLRLRPRAGRLRHPRIREREDGPRLVRAAIRR